MDQMQLLKLEVDRGNGEPVSSNLLQALGAAWDSYEKEIRFRIPILRGYQGYFDDAARHAWLGEVVGRKIDSAKELTHGEAVRILRWLGGFHPSPGNGDYSEFSDWRERVKLVAEWAIAHRDTIAEQAIAIRVATVVHLRDITVDQVLCREEPQPALANLA